MTFDELYHKLLQESIETGKTPQAPEGYDPHHLDCLLHPEKFAPVLRTEPCTCTPDESDCARECLFDAIKPDENGKMTIDPDRCVGCSACIEACKKGKLTASRDILPALDAIHKHDGPVYALIAPAFLGQFHEDVTPGMLRNAFYKMGFDGMIEVALFADILTLKEALEFDKNINSESDYQLTSCCCPMWIAMIRKVYHEMLPHVPGAVSPMVACGRTVKRLHPNALTIFIGPCLAKKSEAKEPDIADAIDYVLTFQEVQDVFEAMAIDPAKMEENERDHSSRAGRIYARAGGVSEAVSNTVERLNPHRKIAVKTKKADGIPACRALMEELKSGKSEANFFEGMGCVGGCVGGPRAIIDREKGRENVNEYGDAATYSTPIDNPHVIELLHLLGFDTVESLLEESDIFTRDFRA